jgi:acetylornithine deacetylase/succinyl-diaminopimelate desuccinylase family protein
MTNDAMKTWFESKRGELRELLAGLVGARTVNPPGDEWKAVEVIEKYLAPLGIPSARHEKEKGRTNLIARVGAGSPKLIIVGHIDTVPEGDGWETDPFTLVEKDGTLRGRGSTDDKGPTAAMLLAAAYLKKHENELAGEVLLVAAADEERGSDLGLGWLLDSGVLKGDLAIIPDAASAMKTVNIAEKGLFFCEVVSHGKQAHGSTPEKGINAIWNLMEVLRRVRRMKFGVAQHPLLGGPTFNLGTIHGGSAPNMVPATASAQLDMRFLPGDSDRKIIRRIERICRGVEKKVPGARFEVKLMQGQQPIEVPQDHPLVKAIQDETEAVLGFRPGVAGMGGSTVAKHLMGKGITAVNFCPGPDVAHQANEYVTLDELVDFTHVLTRIVLRILKRG